MRQVKTYTGTTYFFTNRLWLHVFDRRKTRILWYDWGIFNRVLHTPWFMLAWRGNILSLKGKK